MKNFKNSSEIAGQSNPRHVKPHKHDANLQKNSALYFQVGLILCLLVTYTLFEMKFENKSVLLSQVEIDDPLAEVTPEVFRMEENTPRQIEQNKPTVLLNQAPIIKPDDFETPSEVFLTEPEIYQKPVNPDHINLVAAPEGDEPEIFNILGVEQVPIYPGCEAATTNDERRSCMSDKLSALIQQRFDTSIASDLGMTGVQKIYVQFKIDEKGNVTEIISRAPSQKLEDEAKRVLSKVPQLTPGKQRQRPVSVMYTLPIIFDVQ